LVVDDSMVNRRMLVQALGREGYEGRTATDGIEALSKLREQADVDAVLLDLEMPGLDGYAVLAEIKRDEALRHLPVIVITGVEELSSIVRCIELGAADYLPKPFNPALLRARLNACLAEKRLRDLEREYLEQVGHVAAAAAAVESGAFAPAMLDQVRQRADALGQLARVFQQMAQEVELRERRLRQRLDRVLLDLEERQRGEAETVGVYIPMDRRRALATGEPLPETSDGAALFVDVSGFTALTAALARDLGLRRGAEELIRHLNRVFDGLIASLHRYGGSAIGFAGDAMTCWFGDDDGRRALASAFAMLESMESRCSVAIPSGPPIMLKVKVAVVRGRTRRFLVGNPEVQVFDVLAGDVLDDLARAERLARDGEVLVDERTAALVAVQEWRMHTATGRRFAVVAPQGELHPSAPWPALPADQPQAQLARPWLASTVFERVRSGKTEFLAELQPAAALFLGFSGIAYERDPGAGECLDAFVRWAQSIIVRYDGTLLQVTVGDKGSYLYVVFGAPRAHGDDPVRAVAAALELSAIPATIAGVALSGIGVAYGQMRAGAYGGSEQRTYGVQGDKTNLAAYLMQHAAGAILCDEASHHTARESFVFEALPPLRAKGSEAFVPVYRPAAASVDAAVKSRIDRLPADQQVLLKIASVVGTIVATSVLEAIVPFPQDRPRVEELLDELAISGMLERVDADGVPTYAFRDSLVHEHAYESLLFAQRRHLHRAVAEWYENEHGADVGPFLAVLADHWAKADDPTKAVHYLERAGQWAHDQGDFEAAERLLRASIELESSAGVISDEFRGAHATRGVEAGDARSRPYASREPWEPSHVPSPGDRPRAGYSQPMSRRLNQLPGDKAGSSEARE
jgi:CheY-like chemotaxis protein